MNLLCKDMDSKCHHNVSDCQAEKDYVRLDAAFPGRPDIKEDRISRAWRNHKEEHNRSAMGNLIKFFIHDREGICLELWGADKI